MTIVEMIDFRLINMPCCGQLLCWVNSRLPNYCPECGKGPMLVKTHPESIMLHDPNAWLNFDSPKAGL